QAGATDLVRNHLGGQGDPREQPGEFACGVGVAAALLLQDVLSDGQKVGFHYPPFSEKGPTRTGRCPLPKHTMAGGAVGFELAKSYGRSNGPSCYFPRDGTGGKELQNAKCKMQNANCKLSICNLQFAFCILHFAIALLLFASGAG